MHAHRAGPAVIVTGILAIALTLGLSAALLAPRPLEAQAPTNKPVLHGQHWVAITGKPLGATAGAAIFQQGGNAVDAAAAMLAATSTMWDVLSWGGETQALIYNPNTERVIGVNALGVAPTGATPEFFEEEGHERYPPNYGPLAAVTPGTPGGLMTMLAEWGTMSLEDVIAPAIQMAEEGYPIEAQTANSIERSKERIKQWRYATEVFLPHLGSEEREAPYPGEIFRQPDLANTLNRLVEAERAALERGASREEAIYAAYDRFYRGDIAEEIARGTQEEGGLITVDDMANWSVEIEEPVSTNYHGYEVYKLTHWVQSPVLLQSLNILENFDVEAMGYNSARYIHALYQSMNLAFADRDFYYGDPYFPPEEPIAGLLSKDYARERAELIDWERNDPDVMPGNPYAFQAGQHPFPELLESWRSWEEEDETTTAAAFDAGTAASTGGEPGAGASGARPVTSVSSPRSGPGSPGFEDVDGDGLDDRYYAGTTSIQAVDADGWVVSVTPSGGWVPAVVAGETGVGLSQRMQSFVLHEEENPYNVVEPGKRPRATLTPTIVLRDGRPWVSVAVQGGDSQDQNTLQFLLNMIHFDMDVQEAVEAANINSYQFYGSFGDHPRDPGRLMVQDETPSWVRATLDEMGYSVFSVDRTSGPLNAVWFDWEHGSFWGGSSDHGEDYGIAW